MTVVGLFERGTPFIERRGIETSLIAGTATYKTHGDYPQTQMHSFMPYQHPYSLTTGTLRAFYLRVLVLGRFVADTDRRKLPAPFLKKEDSSDALSEWQAIIGSENMAELKRQGLSVYDFLNTVFNRKGSPSRIFKILQQTFWHFDKEKSQRRVRRRQTDMGIDQDYRKMQKFMGDKNGVEKRLPLPKYWGAHSAISCGEY
jgi:hypothetical protein